MSPLMIGVIGIIVFIVLIFLGMNIGLALMAVGVAGYAVIVNPNAALALLRTDPATQASTYSFMVIPLFIMMGNFAYYAGLSGELYNAANKWLNRLPGALACATVVACAGFGAICGSCAATCATMGTIALPEMRKYKYDDQLSTGSICMGGTLGVLIPPSTPMIIYGIMAETSIGQLFIAGILPGLMMAALCVLTIVLLCVTRKDIAPSPYRFSWRERFAALKGLIPVVILFGVVLGGMFTGFFSINQSACVGAALALVIMAVTGNMSWANFKDAMKQSVATFSMTFLIIIGASVFCKFLTISTLPAVLAAAIGNMNVSRYVILALMTLIYLFLGMIMDELPMIMLTVPIFLPIIKVLGWSPVWFGIYVIMCMELGAISPPVGLNCFIIKGIARDIPLTTIYRGALPFIITVFIAIALLAAFPQIALLLPELGSISG